MSSERSEPKVEYLPAEREYEANDSAAHKKSVREIVNVVQTLLKNMQDQFQAMTDEMIGRIDEMDNRIDELDKNIANAMTMAGIQNDK